MDKFNKSFFEEDTTDLPSSDNGNKLPVDPSLIEETTDFGKFDLDTYLNVPLDDGVPLPSMYPDAPLDGLALPFVYPDAELMTRDFQTKIEYDEDYNGESSGTYVNPAHISSYSGVDQGQAALQEDYSGEPSGTYPDSTVVHSSAGVSQGEGQGQPPLSIIPIDPALLGLDPTQESQYLNAILNHFSSPITPLRVIDRVNFPFEQHLQSALEEELEREKQQELVDALRNGMASPAPAPLPAPRRIAGMKQAGNKRPDNIRNFNPAEFYEPLRSRPTSWGSINPDTGDQLFQYTENGELNPLHSFTVGQIVEYIGKHPLHSLRSSTKKSGLKLWVQTVPADSGRRYPDKLSDKCRFADCPDPYRTIRKGEFRIAFDEQSTKRKTDPFHNAGYVHLYCLEKFVDFPQLCKDYNVQPDTRLFREGKNKMAITRDHESMAGIVRDFIVDSQPWPQFIPTVPEESYGQRPVQYYHHTLSSRLTGEHLDKQPKHLQKIREIREGNSIDVHKNNLDYRVENAKRLKENKRLGLVEPKPKQQKRKSEEKVEEESVLDDDFLASSPSPKRQKKSASPIPSPTRRTKKHASPIQVLERRRTRSSGSIPSPTSLKSPKSRKAASPSSMPSPKKLKHEDADFVPPSPKKRKSEDADSSPEPKRRRSPRTQENISWTDDFHVHGLPF